MLSAMVGGILLAVCALAALGRGQLTLFGESVTGGEFLMRAGPVFGSVGIVLSLVAIGLSRDARWARPMMLIVWLIPVTEGLVRLVTGSLEHNLLFVPFIVSLVALPMAYVYLYRRDNVKRYFDARLTPGAPR